MASSAPAATVGLALHSLAAAMTYGSVLILLLTAIPMLVIANAYRPVQHVEVQRRGVARVGRPGDQPVPGLHGGWLMIVAYIVGTVAEILLLGPSVLAGFGCTSWDNVIETATAGKREWRPVRPGWGW